MENLLSLSEDVIAINISHHKKVIASCRKIFYFKDKFFNTFLFSTNIEGTNLLLMEKMDLNLLLVNSIPKTAKEGTHF